MERIFRFLHARRKLLIVVLVICLVVLLISRSRANGNGTTKEDTVKRGTVEEELTLTGEVKATEYAILQFNASGTVSWVGVKVGDVVKKGQALMKLDTVKLNSAYQVALSNLRAAEANLDEIHDSVKGNDSDETFAQKNLRTAAETAKDKAYEAFVAAQKDLRDSTLVAPFGGIIAIVNTESSGINITATTPQVVLVNPETTYFEVSADQTEVSRFKVGDKAKIVLDAFDEETIEGQVTSISVAPDTTESGTVYPIRIMLQKSAIEKYKIAMTGDASFVTSRKENVLYVPSSFVNSDKEGQYVLVANKEKRYIEVGIEGADSTEITGNILEGDKVFD